MGVLRSCRGLEPWSTASIFQLRTDIFLEPIFSWEKASGFWIILWIWAWRLKTQKCRRYWSSDLGQHLFVLCVSPPIFFNGPVPKSSLIVQGPAFFLVETTEKASHFLSISFPPSVSLPAFQAADLLADTERALGWLFAPMKGRAFTRKKWGVRVLSTNKHWVCNKIVV